MIWDGNRWLEDKKGAIDQKATQTIRAIYAAVRNSDNSDIKEMLINHAQRSETANKLRAMINLATSESNIPIVSDELDQQPWLLTVNRELLI